jgi:hypothetical protein
MHIKSSYKFFALSEHKRAIVQIDPRASQSMPLPKLQEFKIETTRSF